MAIVSLVDRLRTRAPIAELTSSRFATAINYNATGDLYIALVRGDGSLLLASPCT
jgi:hypothetical protein